MSTPDARRRPRDLHGTLVDRLGRDIVTGRLAPGAVINLTTLPAELAVSRIVLREAVRTLAAKGLVTARPYHGTRVTEPERWHLLDPQVLGWMPRRARARQLAHFGAALRVVGELLPGNRFYAHVLHVVGEAS